MTEQASGTEDSENSTSRESWEETLKRTSSWILAPDQRIHSFNSRPYFMIIALILWICQACYKIYDIIFSGNYLEPSISEWIIFALSNVFHFTMYIFIVIPLEIAHGTVQISIFYLLSFAYPFTIMKIIMNYNYLYLDLSTYGFVGLHLLNIVKNWRVFSYKYIRLIAIFLPLFTRHSYHTYLAVKDGYWRITLCNETIVFGGILFGIMLGYYWIYRNHEQDKPETKWKNYSIIITILTAYFVVMELSELHLTFDEYIRMNYET